MAWAHVPSIYLEINFKLQVLETYRNLTHISYNLSQEKARRNNKLNLSSKDLDSKSNSDSSFPSNHSLSIYLSLLRH